MTAASLAVRLTHSDARVRHVAALDLRASRPDAALLAVVMDRVRQEPEDRIRLVLIRFLGAAGDVASQLFLATMREDGALPAPVSHAAILAHDEIEVRLRGKPA